MFSQAEERRVRQGGVCGARDGAVTFFGDTVVLVGAVSDGGF